MKLKVNLRARDQELTAHVEVTGGGQSRCAKGRCRTQGIRYTFAIEDVLNDAGEEATGAVAREAKRILRRELDPGRALCTKHFTKYLTRITELDELEVEIIET